MAAVAARPVFLPWSMYYCSDMMSQTLQPILAHISSYNNAGKGVEIESVLAQQYKIVFFF